MRASTFYLLLFAVFFTPLAVRAENASQAMDRFYSDLARIIENHMDQPDEAVRQVKAYYRTHPGDVDQIRQHTQSAMSQGMAMMNQYASMSDEELDQLARDAERYQPAGADPAERYTKALQAFSMKYPREGAEIASQAGTFASGGGSPFGTLQENEESE